MFKNWRVKSTTNFAFYHSLLVFWIKLYTGTFLKVTLNYARAKRKLWSVEKQNSCHLQYYGKSCVTPVILVSIKALKEQHMISSQYYFVWCCRNVVCTQSTDCAHHSYLIHYVHVQTSKHVLILLQTYHFIFSFEVRKLFMKPLKSNQDNENYYAP